MWRSERRRRTRERSRPRRLALSGDFRCRVPHEKYSPQPSRVSTWGPFIERRNVWYLDFPGGLGCTFSCCCRRESGSSPREIRYARKGTGGDFVREGQCVCFDTRPPPPEADLFCYRLYTYPRANQFLATRGGVPASFLFTPTHAQQDFAKLQIADLLPAVVEQINLNIARTSI